MAAGLGCRNVHSPNGVSASGSQKMFLHKSILIHDVRVQNPDPVFAEKLLEQYGGATGELSAALSRGEAFFA